MHHHVGKMCVEVGRNMVNASYISNDMKELEEQVLRVLDDLSLVQSDCDPRWLAIARTNIEQGFMAMNRAIFKPERVSLDDDA